MWQVGHLCYLCHLQMLEQFQAATFQNNCIERGRNDIQSRKCCLLHPPLSPTPLRTRREFTSPFCHQEFLGVHVACRLWSPCSPYISPTPTLAAWTKRKLLTAVPLPKQPLKQGQLPAHILLPEPNTFFISKFIC